MKKTAKSIIALVTAAMIQDDKASKPNIDPTFSCPDFKVSDAHIQEKITETKDGKTVRRHLVIKTPNGVRYEGIADAHEAGMLRETNEGFEAAVGYTLSYVEGRPVVAA